MHAPPPDTTQQQGSARTPTREEFYRLLVDSVQDYAVFALGTDGHVLTWNSGAERFKGFCVDEIVGRHFSVFYPPEDIAAGKPPRALDDTRRVASAGAANRTKSEFLTAMRHELRTPLNAIACYAELLLLLGVRGPVTEPQREDLERIRRSQQHLLGIINDLLNYSRLEAGQVHLADEVVSLGTLASAAVEMVAPQARAKRPMVEALTCARPVLACGDRAKVEQVLLNQLSNAVKFTPAEGRVTIACADDENDAVHVTVTDSGPGIPEAQRAAVFEPFVQLGRSLTTGHEGTGLGLAISRDLARAMNGDLSVDAAPHGGARFTLRLRRML